jgi:hypothetical protein
MGCGSAGKNKSVYTGNQVGAYNFVGLMNFLGGGPIGSGLSAGTTVIQILPNGTNRRPWLRQDAKLDEKLLDACYPTIELNWFVELELEPDTIFRVSNKSFYVQDESGENRYIDARVERPPSVSVTVGEWLNPNYEVSDTQFSLNNRDGYYNRWLPFGDDYRQWSGTKVRIYIGFGEKRSNYLKLFEGQITTKQGLSTTKDTIEIKVYDKLDLDEIPLPPRTFSSDNFPDIAEDAGGKSIPIVYGDWTEDVPAAGSVNAICINALDDFALGYLFKVSDIELESIDEIYLHRGKRKEGEPGGPVKINLAGVFLDLPNGQFSIPKGIDVLDSEINYNDNDTAGLGSGLNLITAKDSSVDFISSKIQPGDRVIKRSTGEQAFVSTILVAQLQLTGGVTFNDGDEYLILTRKYAFIRGDKLTVKCKGKSLNLISIDRISDISSMIKAPSSISLDFDFSFWISDNTTQKIYNVSFGKEILKTINYSEIHLSITSISSISIASDKKLWVTDPLQSKVFRYDHEEDQLGLVIDTNDVVGIGATLANIQGIAVQSDNKFWIVDQVSGNFYEIDTFAAVEPFVTRTFNKSAFDSAATEILDISVDEQNDQLVVADRSTNKYYRVSRTGGTLGSSTSFSVLAPNVEFVTGVSVAQDASLFFVDQGTLSIYNYNEASDASTNPAFIARDMLQKFGGHTFDQFDLAWNLTARQLSLFKCRAVLDKKTNLITFINKLLSQYNVVFHIRFNRFSLFWITFSNFRTDGKLAKEKDIKADTFKPSKEMNQYFNSAVATYSLRPFNAQSSTSDTYVSPAAVTFAGKEVPKTLELPNIYRREDLDRLIPLYIKLSAPEPEFVEVTFGFRLIRSQMQDFLNVLFDGDVNCLTGKKESGRRYDNVPCMVRKMSYDLGPMTIAMKLWSLGTTAFGNYVPKGRTVGGEFDTVVLSNLGRLGRISPIGTITALGSTPNSLQLEDVNGANAQTRQSGLVGPCWQAEHKVDIIDGATKIILQTLTIQSSNNDEVVFFEDVAVSITPTIKNPAGFIVGGHFLQYSEYPNLTNLQKQHYASYTKPQNNYPTSRTQELEEQRAGQHSFDDSGLPYVLYPIAFVSY